MSPGTNTASDTRREPVDGAAPAQFYSIAPYHGSAFGLGDETVVHDYRALLREHLAQAEKAGFAGTVLYNFPRALDPWALATEILRDTDRLQPIVSIQASHEHPVAAARRAATLSYLYGRRINLNIVAGASRTASRSLGDPDREQTRRRLGEFIEIVARLSREIVSFEGEFFYLDGVELSPKSTSDMRTQIFTPGSLSRGSTAQVPAWTEYCLTMAKPVSDIAVELTRVVGASGIRSAMLVGVIARARSDSAWNLAREDAGAGRRERMAARVQAADNLSTQHTKNLENAKAGSVQDDLLWYGSARVGIDCPKLVGSYGEVAQRLIDYQDAGATDFIFDLPTNPAEYEHLSLVIRRFRELASGPLTTGQSAPPPS